MDLAKTNTTPIGVIGKQLEDLVQDIAILGCRELGVHLEINYNYGINKNPLAGAPNRAQGLTARLLM